MTVKVVVDQQIFAEQPRGGISRYFTELLRQFRTDGGLGVTALTPFRYAVNEHLREMDPNVRRPPVPAALQRGRVVRRLNGRRFRTPADLVHYTYYFKDSLDQRRHGSRPTVCTIYDMTPELYPELFPHGSPHRAKRQFASECTGILCISETTKADLIRLYGPFDKPVVVSPLGVRPDFFAARATPQPRRYVLFVGQRDGYKNFAALLDAFADVSAAHPDVDLLCVGSSLDAYEQRRVDELGMSGRVASRRVSDDELPSVYAGAAVLAYPSDYEGFGLPAVEAFAAGCPVLVVDTPCMVEVGGDAAVVVPSSAPRDLAAGLDLVLGDPAVRADHVRRGRERAESFTWHRTARITADFYRQLLAEHHL